MPKITTKTFIIAGQSRQFGIWYTESDKFFVKDFDENVGGRFHSAKFGGGGNCPTEEDLYEKIKSAIKAYEEKIAESKKVIIIKLDAAKEHLGDYENEDRSRMASNYVPGWLSAIYESGDLGTMGFYIRFEVKMFRKVGNRHEFFDVQEGGRLVNCESISNLEMYQIIDWSQEKEDALKKLQTMFDSLLHKFVTAMSSPELFIEAINNQKLLLG